MARRMSGVARISEKQVTWYSPLLGGPSVSAGDGQEGLYCSAGLQGVAGSSVGFRGNRATGAHEYISIVLQMDIVK